MNLAKPARKWSKLGLAAAGLTLAALSGGQLMASAPEGPDASTLEKGRQIFNDWSCSACHVLADAGGTGHVGPALDGNAALTKDFVVSRVTNGAGAMPGFGGQMTDEEIDVLSTYIVAVKK